MKRRMIAIFFLSLLAACEREVEPAAVPPVVEPAPGAAAPAAPAAPAETAATPSVETSEAERAALGPVLSHYLDAQERLAADDLDGARAAATAAVKAIGSIKLPEGEASQAWGAMSESIVDRAALVISATTIGEAREAFARWTDAVEPVIATFGNVSGAPLRRAHCPMALEGRGASWFQRAEKVDNTYFGDEMRRCGSIKGTAAPGEALM